MLRLSVLLLSLSILSGMTACTDTGSRTSHPGLSPDGYGFVQNGPVLAPPEHLVQHQSPVPSSVPGQH
ncbi:hypothetical protein NQF87_07410 [Bombella sp. TMW 2.2559]|uniref:Lipoprotein n=1 Tax=Bombella dulcis TaxID=2967339 RepID=A0ABT3WGN1_9PROT|nr:hypothetical protein [Bombella dulcis]MCX5616798.1 hypothetical protein [Bombella dulcis]